MKLNVMKLFRDLMKLGKVETPEGVLIYEGDVLAEGTEVFIEDADGNIVPAPDGQYGEYTVKEGKIAAKEEEKPAESEAEKPADEEVAEKKENCEEEEVEPEASVEEEPKDDKEERIAALEQAVAELKGALAELIAKKEDEAFSAMKPAEKEIKDVQTCKGKGALKYFE